MSVQDKDIVITPNIGSSTDDPKIQFKGGNANVATEVTLRVYPNNSGTLSFEGSSGQLFSITNDLTGSIFSVNDVSGIPSIDVNADGTIYLATYNGNVGIGTSTVSNKFVVYGGNIVVGSTGYGFVFPDGSLQTLAFSSSSAVTSFRTTLSGLTPSSASTGVIALSGTLGVGNGGTGGTTFTSNGVLYGNAAGALQVTAQGAANSVLTANAGAPAFSATPTVTSLTTTSSLTAGNGLTVSAGGASVTGNLSVSGNLIIGGNITVNSSNVLITEEPIIYIGEENPANLWDLGIVGSYTTNRYRHTGLLRNKDDGVWTIFDNLITEPSQTINWSQDQLNYGSFKVGNINVAATTASTGTTTGSIVTAGGVGIARSLNVGGSLKAANQLLLEKSYSVAPATNVTINITDDSTTLVDGWVHRIELNTQGTGTSTGAVYLVYQTAVGTWKAREASWNYAAGGNNPRLLVSGTTLQIFHDHATLTYPIEVRIVSKYTGNVTLTNPSFFGLEGGMTLYNNLIGIGTTIPGVTLDIVQNSTYNSEGLAAFYIRSGNGATNAGLLMGADKTNNIAYIQSLEPATSYGSKALTLNPNGGVVGIGTFAPTSARLHIYTNADEVLRIENSTTAGGHIRFINQSGSMSIGMTGATSNTLLIYDRTNSQSAYQYTGGATGYHLFATQNTERMRIDANGYVGIGTISPSSSYVSKFINIHDATSSGIVLSSAFSTTGKKFSMYSASGGALVFTDETAASTRMIIDTYGNVSIGTTAVAAPAANRTSLTVNGTSESLFGLYNGGVIKGYLYTASTSDMYLAVQSGFLLLKTVAAQPIVFNVSNTTEVMRITSTGYVGIGSSTPTTSFDVSNGGIAGVQTVARFASSGNGAAGRGAKIIIGAPGLSNIVNVAELVGYQETGSTTASAASFAINVANTSGTLTERMRIDSNGNIGVGTTTPFTMLEVQKAVNVYWVPANGDWTSTPHALTISNSYAGGYDPVLLYRMADSTSVEKNAGAIGLIGRDAWTSGNNATQIADMYFAVRNNSGGISERMRITSGGFIGIGTSNPQNNTTMTVYGATSGITFSNATTGISGTDGFQIGNFGTANAYLYNYEAANLLFGTSGTEVMRIDSTGQVGIGTSPGTSFIAMSRAAGSGILSLQMNGTPIIGNRLFLLGFGSDADPYKARIEGFAEDNWTAGSSTPCYLRFTTTPSGSATTVERMRIDQYGNVSIGTTSVFYPAANRTSLSVNGTSTSLLSLGTGGTQRAYLYHDGSQLSLTAASGLLTLAVNTANPMVFYTSSIERMRIDANGNVGIGITSPTSTLHVVGNVNIVQTNSTFKFTGANATVQSNIAVTMYPDGTLSFDGTAGQLFSITNSLTGSLFSVNDVTGIPLIEALDSGTVKLVELGGNVGIGTGSVSSGNILAVFGGNIVIGSAGKSLRFPDGTMQTTAYTGATAGVTTFSAGTTGFTPSSATGGAITLAGTLSLSNGGTNAALTASNGGVVYSTGSAMAILSGTATAGQHLQSGASGAPSWTTATFPSTATGTGSILRANGTNWVASTVTYVDSGTSGGIPYYSSTSAISSSALLTASALMVGGGAGAAPSTITTGTGVTTALGVAVGSAGAFVVNGGALGTPSGGTLTNCTGLPAAGGGTGQSSYTIGDILYASASNALSKLADVATGNALISGGVGVAPSYGKIGLTTHVSGTLPIANGGTNATATPTNGGISYGTGSAYAFTAAGSANQALISNGAAAPSWVTLDLTYLPDSAFKKSVKAATTGNIALSGAQTLDGISCVAGDRVLVKDQTTASQNGIYTVAAGAWTRTADADTASEIAGGTVNVDQGTLWGSVLFSNNLKTTDTLNVTAMNWSFLINNNSTQTMTNKTMSTSCVWNGTAVGTAYGGTGLSGATPFNANGVMYANSTSALTTTAQGGANTILIANAGAPSWSATPTIGTSVTCPIHYGGTAASSTLTLQSTSGAGTTDSIIFKTGNAGANTAMTITSAGNVGIATTSASAALVVYKGVATSLSDYAAEFITSTGVVNSGRVIFSQGSTYAFGIGALGTAATTSILSFTSFTKSTGALGASPLTLSYLGNVGISNTNPLYTLDVAGTARVAATVAPTVDQLTITNAGFPVTTAGISALQMTYIGGAANVEASVARIDLTPGTTSGGIWNAFRSVVTTDATTGVTLNGIKMDTIATPGAGTSNAMYVGTGWDSILNYNGTAVIDGTGNWVGPDISLASGGTGATLTASNGGIVYSTATAFAVLAGTATAGQILRSGASTTPSWSTATYPATGGTAGTILRSDGTNWVNTTTTWPTTTTAGTILVSATASAITATATPTLGVVSSATGSLAFANAGSAFLTTIQAGVATAAVTYTLPTAAPAANGYVLTATTAGVMSWAAAAGGGATITDDTTTNASRYLLWEDATSGTSTTVGVSSTKLYFNPSTGTLSATVFTSLSDETVKENITVITNPVEKVQQLKGVTFNWKENNEESAGLIAQDVERVLPCLVKQDEDYKTLNYNGVIGLLVEAVKELTDKIETQQNEITQLKSLLNSRDNG